MIQSYVKISINEYDTLRSSRKALINIKNMLKNLDVRTNKYEHISMYGSYLEYIHTIPNKTKNEVDSLLVKIKNTLNNMELI